jgi:hypothetical protein
MLRMFRLARASAVKSRTQAVNQLKAVLDETFLVLAVEDAARTAAAAVADIQS